jgi:hypothetical protein
MPPFVAAFGAPAVVLADDRIGAATVLSQLTLIGHAVVASAAAGRGPRLLALVGGPAKDQPLPTVVRCRERRRDVAPCEGLVYEHP